MIIITQSDGHIKLIYTYFSPFYNPESFEDMFAIPMQSGGQMEQVFWKTSRNN